MPKATTTKAVTKTAATKTTAAKPAAPKAAATQAAPKKVAAKKAVTRKPAAAKPAATSKPSATTVIAKIDAGFGNQLFIRGSGAGLTWDAGVLMQNTGPNEWVWKSTAVTSELEFKVLLNDTVWATGPNGVAFGGATVVFEPVF